MDVFSQIARKMTGVFDRSGQVSSAQDQDPEDIKLAGFVKQKVEDCRQNGSRIANEAIWMTNIAYLMGFDSVWFDASTREFRNVAQPARALKRNRLHVNKILPTIQNRTARLCKSPPKYDVRPESSSLDDKDAARLGLQIIDQVWDQQKINEKRIDLMMWAQQCGHAYIKVFWDDESGKELINPDGTLEGFEGEIKVETRSSFEIFADPLAKTFDQVSWLVEAKVRKLDYFRSHYEKGYLVKEENAWLLSTQYEQRINTMTPNGATSGTNFQMKNSAIEMTYYERRSKKYPRGRMVIVANGVVLEDKDLPVGIIPFAKFDDVVVAGKYFSESIITHLRPIQDQYNRLITKRAEWTNKLLAGKYLAAKGHGLIREALNDQSGEVLEYNPVPGGASPQAMQIPTIPQYAYTEEDRLDAMMNYIAGIGEISRGELPSASIPAVGMQFLQEQDQTRIGIMVEQHEQAWASVGQLILRYAGQFYKMPRLLKSAGKTLQYTVKKVTGEMLKNNYDVIVIRGSTLPNSKVLKRQEILNAYQQGLLGQPGDPKLMQKLLDMLEFGDIAEMWEDHAIDMARIQKDIGLIEQGIMPFVHELDNHELYILELNRYRKTDKFEKLTPQAQDILNACLEMHLQEIIKVMDPNLDENEELARENVNQVQSITGTPQEEMMSAETVM